VLFGLGLSFRLREQLPFAGPHVLVSVVCFDLGVEAAQFAVVVALALGAARLMRNSAATRVVLVLLSALVVHIAWHTMIDRASAFGDRGWPAPDVQSLVIAARWIAGTGLAIVGARYLARRLEERALT
jgi:hypothetical protein